MVLLYQNLIFIFHSATPSSSQYSHSSLKLTYFSTDNFLLSLKVMKILEVLKLDYSLGIFSNVNSKLYIGTDVFSHSGISNLRAASGCFYIFLESIESIDRKFLSVCFENKQRFEFALYSVIPCGIVRYIVRICESFQYVLDNGGVVE